ncbi:MAG: glycosyltransferase [Cyanobacteria bacterium J06623_4]
MPPISAERVTPPEPIRIFIGSSPKNIIEEQVFRYTLSKHANSQLELYIIDGTTGSATNLTTQAVKQLPRNLIEAIPGATAFSLARWAIPEWCNYQGRAIYCDSDQIVLTDIKELWDFDLSGNVVAAVPLTAAKCQPHYKATIINGLRSDNEYHLASVMLIDCQQAKIWSLAKIIDWVSQQKQSGKAPDVMWLGKNFRKSFQVGVQPLPAGWNHLDWLDADSRLVHFTDLTSQPWRFHHHPLSSLWEDLFIEALAEGELTLETIEAARQAGYICQRVSTLAHLPVEVRTPINRLWRAWGTFGSLIVRAVSQCQQALLSSLRAVRSQLKQLTKATS